MVFSFFLFSNQLNNVNSYDGSIKFQLFKKYEKKNYLQEAK